MVSGDPPFDHRKLIMLMRLVIGSKYNFNKSIWKTVSSETKDLIKKLMNPNIKERLTIDEALDHPALAQAKINDMRRIEEELKKSTLDDSEDTSTFCSSQHKQVEKSPEGRASSKVDYKRKFRIAVYAIIFGLRVEKMENDPKMIDTFDLNHNPYTLKVARDEMVDFTYKLYSYSCHMNRLENINHSSEMFQHVPKLINKSNEKSDENCGEFESSDNVPSSF